MTAWRNQTSQAGFQTYATNTLGATNLWPLGDTGTTVFNGPFPGGAANPCGHVLVTVGTASPARCVHPSQSTACPFPNVASISLQALAAAPSAQLTVPTTGTSQTLTTTVTRASTYNTGYNNGLHLLFPVQITTTNFNQTFLWTANRLII